MRVDLRVIPPPATVRESTGAAVWEMAADAGGYVGDGAGENGGDGAEEQGGTVDEMEQGNYGGGGSVDDVDDGQLPPCPGVLYILPDSNRLPVAGYPFCLRGRGQTPWPWSCTILEGTVSLHAVADPKTGNLACEGAASAYGGPCESCQLLSENRQPKGVIERAKEEVVVVRDGGRKHCELTAHHLAERTNVHKDRTQQQRLPWFDSSKHTGRLTENFDVHKRITLLLGSKNIPGLKRVFAESLRKGRSPHAILDQLTRAMNGVYRTQSYSDADIDMAAVTTMLGRSALLNVLCKADGLPSVSDVQKKLQESDVGFSTCAMGDSSSIEAAVRANIHAFMATLKPGKHLWFLMVDEIAVNPRPQWEREDGTYTGDNQVLGICGQHTTTGVDTTLFDMDSLVTLKDLLDKGAIHFTTEGSMFVIGKFGGGGSAAFPVLLLDSCKASNPEQQNAIIEQILDFWAEVAEPEYGPMITVDTDGDAQRRLLLVEDFTMFKLARLRLPWSTELLTMPLLDTKKSSAPSTPAKGRGQNVVRLLKTVAQVGLAPDDRVEEALAGKPFLKRVHANMKILVIINKHLLAMLFENMRGVASILAGLACVAHLSLLLYRANRMKFFPAQLYHDMQTIVRSAYFLVAIAKHVCPEDPLFFFQLGTDRLEQLFAFVRTTTHDRNCDMLLLALRFASAYQLAKIYDKHPSWRRPSKRLEGSEDAMNTLSWMEGAEGNTRVDGVDLRECWVNGREKAVGALFAHPHYNGKVDLDTFRNLQNAGITMFKPLDGNTMPGVSSKEDALDENDESGEANQAEEKSEQAVEQDESVPANQPGEEKSEQVDSANGPVRGGGLQMESERSDNRRRAESEEGSIDAGDGVGGGGDGVVVDKGGDPAIDKARQLEEDDDAEALFDETVDRLATRTKRISVPRVIKCGDKEVNVAVVLLFT
ncbi:conserved unknown protein [Ectocarpus siliculosus]|uniref:Uncharacterized protein n=1 Tax=Ectocarpus siliculosus TaxID=2880 RepID=D7G3X4_ECTSI|nr:conserved unknown protein [Ectocarpus siliculosus]|eukprot:CBJ33651.1 conserved unknown protein [Ectocarpus siliculosus]